MEDYNSTMKFSQIKAQMRKSLLKELENYFKTKNAFCGQVDASTLGVVVGTYWDEDGYSHDTCCEVIVRAKPFYDKPAGVDKNGNCSNGISFYDLQTKIDNYKNGVEE